MYDISTIIGNVISMIVWPILFGSVTIMFIYSGIMFATAAGDPSKITSAKKALFFALVGLLVGVIAFSIPTIFSGILGT